MDMRGVLRISNLDPTRANSACIARYVFHVKFKNAPPDDLPFSFASCCICIDFVVSNVVDLRFSHSVRE